MTEMCIFIINRIFIFDFDFYSRCSQNFAYSLQYSGMQYAVFNSTRFII